jgi:hypothetical protein
MEAVCSSQEMVSTYKIALFITQNTIVCRNRKFEAVSKLSFDKTLFVVFFNFFGTFQLITGIENI